MFDIELYIDKNSFAHRMHPSVKLVILFLIFVILMLAQSFKIVVFLDLFLLFLFFFCRVNRILMKFRQLLILIFIITIIMWVLVTREGTVLINAGFLKVTKVGVEKGMLSAFRLTGMFFAGTFIIATTRLEELAYGMKKIGVSERFSFSLTMAIRLIPLYLGSIKQIIDAQTSRGHTIDTDGFLKRIRNYIPLLIPAFLSSIRNINQLSMALEVRGFSRGGEKTDYLHYNFTFLEYFAIIIFLLLFIYVLFVRVGWIF